MTLVRLEHAALIGLAFFLPMFEAPKNLLWLAFVALWLANRARARDFGGAWDYWDTLIVLWIASGYAAAAFAGLQHSEWKGTNDLLRYGSTLWLMKRSRYPAPLLSALLLALCIGTLATLGWGFWRYFVHERAIGLKSVGHVNHSAIYLGIVICMALLALRAHWTRLAVPWRALGIVALLAFALALVMMLSRAAIGATLAVALLLLAVYATRSRRSVRATAIAVVVVLGAALALYPQVLEKSVDFIRKGTVLSYRDGIWRAALLAAREFPLFGVGMSNYGRVGYDELERWSAKRGEQLDRASVVVSSHGHSLYFNTLAERGALGLAALLAVLVAWAHALLRRLPRADAPPLAWSLWGGAASAWLITVTVGFVNTTLHHEHALLSVLLLGAWLAHADRPSD